MNYGECATEDCGNPTVIVCRFQSSQSRTSDRRSSGLATRWSVPGVGHASQAGANDSELSRGTASGSETESAIDELPSDPGPPGFGWGSYRSATTRLVNQAFEVGSRLEIVSRRPLGCRCDALAHLLNASVTAERRVPSSIT